jgi:HSP20 family molecular chaperone IbpA
VDSEAISADLVDGVLTVHVPKTAIPDRRIEIG